MIPFVKAHACGNDFLVIQEDLAGVEPRDRLTRRLCHRNSGIGADGIEFLTWGGERRGAIRLHNADGSIAEISGNGTRCAAAWIAYETKAGPGDEIVLETDAGRRICRIDSRIGAGFQITSSMGVPQVATANLPLAAGERIEGAVVSTGNPHFVIFVEQPDFSLNGHTWERSEKRSAATLPFPSKRMWNSFAWPAVMKLRHAFMSAALALPRHPALAPAPQAAQPSLYAAPRGCCA